MGIVAAASEVIGYRNLIKELIIRDLKLRYERSVLGFLWSLLNPLLMIGIYTFVFSMVLRSSIQRFPIFLVPVMLPWNFLVRCMLSVSPLVYQSGYLLNRAVFPSESLVFSGLLSAFVDFCLEMAIFVIILAAFGAAFFPSLLVIPLIMFLHLLFVAGVTLFFSVGYVYYRDTQYIAPIISTAWFFMTPVFYSVSNVPEQYRMLYMLNPMVHIAACFRDPLYAGVMPSLTTIVITAVVSCSFFIMGWFFYRRFRNGFTEVI